MLELQNHDVHRLSIDDTLKRMETDGGGLSRDEAQQRLAQYGYNVLIKPNRYSLLHGFTRQFTHFLDVLLWIAAGLSFVADVLQPGEGMAMLGWAIFGVIAINAVFAFFQKYRAECAVQALRQLLPDKTWLTRSGQAVEVRRGDIVPGDIPILEEGERVPADARLTVATGLRVDNAALTGESKPKLRTAVPVQDCDRLDLPNLIFAGTTILSGHGRAVVFATGMGTEFGKIAALTTAVEPGLSPLQREITKVTCVVAAISLIMGAVFFAIGLWTGLSYWISAIFGVGIVLTQIANVFACRSDRLPIMQLGWLTNPLILWGTLSELTILVLISYTPIGNDMFSTSLIPLWIFGPLVLGGLGLLLAEEGRKIVANRFIERLRAPLRGREVLHGS